MRSVITEKNSLSNAVKVLIESLKDDGELYYAYQSSIAMSFYDEMISKKHYNCTKSELKETANIAACNFLNLLIK